MLVKNNREGLVHLGDHVTLLPGANDVPAEKWAEAKKIKVVQHMVAVGVIEADEETELADLSGLVPAKAVALVGETLDRELLGRWAKAEKRAQVVKAIEAQLAKLKVETKAETKSE